MLVMTITGDDDDVYVVEGDDDDSDGGGFVGTSEVMDVPCGTPFSEDVARGYFRDIIQGIEYRE